MSFDEICDAIARVFAWNAVIFCAVSGLIYFFLFLRSL